MRLAIEFGGTNFKLGLIDNSGNVIRIDSIPLQHLIQEKNILKAILSYVNKFLGSEQIVCGGISSKGLVDHDKGMVQDDVGEGKLIENIPLRDIFSDEFSVPFIMDNDARCYAWGEWRFSRDQGINNLTVITFGTGIGCASVFNGKMLYGSDHLGGVMGGHISIDKNGPRCHCGNYGCFELYCSKNALLKQFSSHNLQLIDDDPVKLFFSQLRKNNNKIKNKIFESFIQHVSVGLTNIIHAYGPDVVVLGGGIMKSADLMIDKITHLVNEMAFTVPRGRIKIMQSKLGDTAPLLGAAFHPSLENHHEYTI